MNNDFQKYTKKIISTEKVMLIIHAQPSGEIAKLSFIVPGTAVRELMCLY